MQIRLRVGISLICVTSLSLFAVVGCNQPTKVNHRTSQANRGQVGIAPPSNQYEDSVKKAIGLSNVSNLQFGYIKQLTSTLSLCLFTFNQNGRQLFNEALVSKDNGKWDVAYSAENVPTHEPGPYYQTDMNGSYGGQVVENKAIGSTPYQLIGGFVYDPAISYVEITDQAGENIRRLPITRFGKLRMFAYAEISPTQRIQGWQIKAYDSFGSLISLSATQWKELTKPSVILSHKNRN